MNKARKVALVLLTGTMLASLAVLFLKSDSESRSDRQAAVDLSPAAAPVEASPEATVASAAPAGSQDPIIYPVGAPDGGIAPTRVGEPLAVADASNAVAAAQEVFGDAVGQRCDDVVPRDESKIAQSPMVPFGHPVGDTCYVLGWLDNVALNAAAPVAGQELFTFIYDNDGKALSSFPLPDELSVPDNFPIPPLSD